MYSRKFCFVCPFSPFMEPWAGEMTSTSDPPAFASQVLGLWCVRPCHPGLCAFQASTLPSLSHSSTLSCPPTFKRDSELRKCIPKTIHGFPVLLSKIKRTTHLLEYLIVGFGPYVKLLGERERASVNPRKQNCDRVGPKWQRPAMACLSCFFTHLQVT